MKRSRTGRRIDLVRGLAWAVLLAAGLVGCATSAPQPPHEAGVEHIVLVWLKDPNDSAARDALVEASLGFARIEGVLDVRVGDPIESDRAIVQDDFDLAIVVSLRDRDALTAYLAHPEHARAGRELLGPAAARVLVYDLAVAGRARSDASAGSP